MQPVLRFAPSPNGFLHLGHALSALLNADIAQRLGGRLLLRIEDIDPERCRPTFEAALREDLAWLGLSFAEPVVMRQSQEMATYAAQIEVLRRRGLVYRCFCSRAETARLVAAHEAAGRPWPRDPDGAPLHAGPCAEIPDDIAAARAAAGAPHSWRLRMDRAAALCGALSVRVFDAEGGAAGERACRPEAWGDVVLARRDVPTSYHLAVVVDDARQGITHVVRGRDLESATDVHRVLQCLLDLPDPCYHHHKLLVGDDGAKLAKSSRSTALRDLRADGWTLADVRRAVGLGAGD